MSEFAIVPENSAQWGNEYGECVVSANQLNILPECSSEELESIRDCQECCGQYTQLKVNDDGYDDNPVIVNINYLGKYVFTKSYYWTTNIRKIKFDLSCRFHIPEENLQLMHWHIFLNDTTTLEHIKTDCPGFLDLTVVNTTSEIPNTLEDMVIPDIITVHIESQDIYKDITVEIEDRRMRKPYIGGFRHKETGFEYHHAFSQTGPPAGKVAPRQKNSRDTQTVDIRHRTQEMTYSRYTQMSTEHTWIPTVADKIMTAKRYEDAEERAERIGYLRAVRTIQRYFRRWKINKSLKVVLAEYKQRVLNEDLERLEETADFGKRRKKELINKVFPRTRGDFTMLYAMVDRWKKAHIERISKMHTTSSKLAEFYLLLNKEIQMLSVIERQRNKIKQEMKVVNEIRFFHIIGDPIRWNGYKGVPISMDTLETQKGRTYTDTYYTACNRKLTMDERIKFITDLILALKKHNCTLGNETVELLEREIELLLHGMEDDKLDYLRKRIQALLFKHYHMVECNENVTSRMIKEKRKEMMDNLVFCRRCQTLKLHSDFSINHKNYSFRTCTICSWNDRAVEPWLDIGPYRLILRAIRREERQRSSPSAIVFIIQDRDIYFLVERIWHAQSCINECNDIEKLRLIRWDMNEEWSPWNCVLLTEEEAKSHIRVKNLNKVYDEEFRKIIVSKHMFARCVFANVLYLEKSIRAAEEQKQMEESEEILN